MFEECIKFRHKLWKMAKAEKASIESPGGSGDIIKFPTQENDALMHFVLAREMWLGINTLHCWLRHTIKEAEATMVR